MISPPLSDYEKQRFKEYIGLIADKLRGESYTPTDLSDITAIQHEATARAIRNFALSEIEGEIYALSIGDDAQN